MQAQLPVVFLAFANDLDNHSATLKQESREIFNRLQPLESESESDSDSDSVIPLHRAVDVLLCQQWGNVSSHNPDNNSQCILCKSQQVATKTTISDSRIPFSITKAKRWRYCS